MYSKISKSKSITILASSLIVAANISTLIGSASVLTSYGEDGASPAASSSSSNLQATTYNINANEGNVELTGGGAYTINGNGSETTNLVVIKGNPEGALYEYNITLNNVNIKAKCEGYLDALDIEKGAKVNLTLAGKNTLQGSQTSYGSYSTAIGNDGILSINGDNQSSLSLKDFFCISNSDGCSGNIIIESGNVIMEPIELSMQAKNIEIKGGSLTLKGEYCPVYASDKFNITGGNIGFTDLSADQGYKMLTMHNKNVTITGGIINGVSYPVSEETPFNKDSVSAEENTNY